MDFAPIDINSVLVVDDDADVCKRLSRLLTEVAGDALVVSHAGSIAEAKRHLNDAAFSLALVDVSLPDGSGIELIQSIGTDWPELATVVVSAFAEEKMIVSALQSGAIGYLLKERDDLELVLSLRSLMRGGAPIDPLIARHILGMLVTPPVQDLPREHTEVEATDVQLSQRELEILQMVSRGLSNRDISEVLGLSKLTVEAHNKHIYRKLSVKSRTQAVFEARAMGLVP